MFGTLVEGAELPQTPLRNSFQNAYNAPQKRRPDHTVAWPPLAQPRASRAQPSSFPLTLRQDDPRLRHADVALTRRSVKTSLAPAVRPEPSGIAVVQSPPKMSNAAWWLGNARENRMTSSIPNPFDAADSPSCVELEQPHGNHPPASATNRAARRVTAGHRRDCHSARARSPHRTRMPLLLMAVCG
jgi:hypothetical protein